MTSSQSSIPLQTSFSEIIKISDLQKEISAYEMFTSQILRKRTKKSKSSHKLSYLCQQKREKHCNFRISYNVEIDENKEEFAVLYAEKTHLSHSHDKTHKQYALDCEEMRRCFKALEQEFWKVLAKNSQFSPKPILNMLFEEGSFSERMLVLQGEYSKKFKKSLDNQINKIKRKIRAKNLSFSETTIQRSESSSSFFSEEITTILNFLQDDEKNSFSEVITKSFIGVEEEEKEEGEEELKSIIPIIFY